MDCHHPHRQSVVRWRFLEDRGANRPCFPKSRPESFEEEVGVVVKVARFVCIVSNREIATGPFISFASTFAINKVQQIPDQCTFRFFEPKSLFDERIHFDMVAMEFQKIWIWFGYWDIYEISWQCLSTVEGKSA